MHFLMIIGKFIENTMKLLLGTYFILIFDEKITYEEFRFKLNFNILTILMKCVDEVMADIFTYTYILEIRIIIITYICSQLCLGFEIYYLLI